jgi:hypothetical protein
MTSFERILFPRTHYGSDLFANQPILAAMLHYVGAHPQPIGPGPDREGVASIKPAQYLDQTDYTTAYELPQQALPPNNPSRRLASFAFKSFLPYFIS